jgi:hypothetical protein
VSPINDWHSKEEAVRNEPQARVSGVDAVQFETQRFNLK